MNDIKQLKSSGKPYKNYTIGALCKCRHSFIKHNKKGCCKCSCKKFDYTKDWSKKKTIVRGLVMCSDDMFKGIECISKINDYGEKEYGFEGCYNNDVNHPDLRPAHRIWIKEVYAEKLYRLFKEVIKQEEAGR